MNAPRFVAVLAVFTVLVGSLLMFASADPAPSPALLTGETLPLTRVAPPLAVSHDRQPVAAAAVSSSPDEHGVSVTVRSPEGALVADAHVAIDDGCGVVNRATTSAAGVALVPKPATGTPRLGVWASSYAVHQEWLPRPLPDHFEVMLVAETTITGRVQLADSSPPPLPVRVVAWPAGASRAAQHVARAMAGEHSVPFCDTDASGRFRLGGLRADCRYHVAAGAVGWVSKDTIRNVIPSTRPVELRLWRVAASLVRVRENDGSVPTPSSFARRQNAVRPAPGSEAIAGREIELALAGLGDYAFRSTETAWDETILAFRTADPVAELPDVLVSYVVPGYEDLRARVRVRPLEGSVPVYVARLLRTAQGFGSLDVRFSGVPARPSRIAVSPAFVWLDLRESASRRKLSVPVYDVCEGVTVPGVPQGSYELTAHTFASPDASLLPPTPIVVGSSPVPIVIDGSRLGGVELVLGGRASMRTAGELVLNLESSVAGSRESLTFPEPPYILHGLSAGSYRLTCLRSWFGGADEVGQQLSVNILPGSLGTTEWTF